MILVLQEEIIIQAQHQILSIIILIMASIGQYVSLEETYPPRGSLTEVKVGKKLSSNHKLKAILRILSSKHVEVIRMGSLSLLLDKKRYIKEIFFFEQGQQICMTTIIDQKRTRISQDKIDIGTHLTPQVCLRLMVESVRLIENLHIFGVVLNEPLQRFLQFEKSNTSVYQYSISMISFTTKKYFLHRQKSPNDPNCQTLLGYIRLLQEFLSLLLEKGGRKNDLKIFSDIMNGFQAYEIRDFKSLMKRLLQFTVENKGEQLTIFGSYNIDNDSLDMTFQRKKGSEMTYSNVKMILQMKEEVQLSTEEFFYIFATRQEGKVSQPSFNQLAFSGEGGFSYSSCSKVFLEQGEQGYSKKHFENEMPLQQLPLKPSHYPYCCLGRVLSIFYHNGIKKQIYGTGCLIDSNLVLTAAHLVQPFHISKRIEAQEMYFIWRKQIYKIKNKAYPEEFLEQIHQRQNDFALLLLEKNIFLQKYLHIAKNYRTTNNLSFVTFNNMENDKFMEESITESPCSISNQYQLFRHVFKTKGGDSGSPIMVSIIPNSMEIYIIAIHSGVENFTAYSVKITERVVQILKQFERQLTGYSITITYLSVEFQQVLERFRNLQQQVRSKKDNFDQNQQIIFLKQKMNESKMLTAENGKSIESRQLRQRYLKLIKKSIDFLQNVTQHIFESIDAISPQQNQKRIVIQQNFRNFKKEWLIVLHEQEVQEYLAVTNFAISMLYMDKNLPIQAVQGLFNFLKKKQDVFSIFSIESYQLSVLAKSFVKGNKADTDFVNTEYGPAVILQSFQAMYQKLYNFNLKLQQISFTLLMRSVYFSNAVKLIDLDKLILKFPPQIISPLKCFRNNGYYILRSNVSQFELQVQFQRQEHCRQFCWQQVQFYQPNYLFNYPKIVKNQTSFSLKLKIRRQRNGTFLDFLQLYKKYQIYSLLHLMIKITQFVCNLHQKGFLLCTPIEYCILADISRSTYSFCFFNHHQALFRKIKKHQEQLDTLSNEQIELLKNYYPIQEILNSKGNPFAFQDVDVWMLGKSFERMLRQVDPFYLQSLYYQIKNMISLMIDPEPGQRTTLKNTRQKLKQFAKSYRNDKV